MGAKTFVEMVSTPPKPPGKPTPWEAYLLSLIQNLQKENQSLKCTIQEMQQQQQDKIHTRGEPINTSTQQVGKQEVSPIPPPSQQKEFTQKVVQEVFSTMKENAKKSEIAKKIRIGGLKEGWQDVDILEPEEIEKDTYITVTEEMTRKVTRAVPFVDLGDPVGIYFEGNHAILEYLNKEEKIDVMKQTKSLKGTTVWIADELTPLQLKNRKQELAKVAEARKQGKWAVYRGGVAIIKEFKSKEIPISP